MKILPLPWSAQGIASSLWVFLPPIALDIAQDLKNRNLYTCLFCCMSFMTLSHKHLKVETVLYLMSESRLSNTHQFEIYFIIKQSYNMEVNNFHVQQVWV